MYYISVHMYILRIIRKGKVTMQGEVGEEIMYEIMTELQVFTV